MAGVLEGILVVELGIYAVGPWAAKHLGALGADVIKMEPIEGEGSHYIEPYIKGTAALYISANLNKRHITLDLKNKEQHEQAIEIIRTADVFIENMRPGTIDRLDLGYDKLSELNPRIIFVSASAYGSSGPMAGEAGADPFVQAFCGWCSVTGEKGTEGEILRYMAHLDITTACVTTEAILHALLARERTGRGQKIEVSMLAAAISIQTTRLTEYFATGRQPLPNGSVGTLFAPDQAFRCRDGRYVAVTVTSEAQWKSFCNAIGATELAANERFAENAARIENRDSLAAVLDEIFAAKPLTWWLLQFKRFNVAASRVFDFEDIQIDPQIAANRFVERLETPHWGQILVEGSPWKFEKTPIGPNRPGGLKGEHTGEVLSEFGLRTREFAE
jgi:crotonobetainyl-CoA:carnitine CoA-transferase CaiB-like acyl-CoA transferase